MKTIIAVILLVLISLNLPEPAGAKFHLTYLYEGNTAIYINNVERTKGAIDAVCPDFFKLNDEGDLRLSTNFHRSFIDTMHEKGIKVIPYLTNYWKRELGQAALKNRQNLAEQIKNVVEFYDFDGVNIDIENVTHLERNSYTDFVRLLREKMPDRIITVSVVANPYGYGYGWHGSYDYEKLGYYCDYLIIMAYDEHYLSGLPGPVASAEFVENSIKYALNCNVPREKLVCGVPFYGRYWIQGQSYGGYSITNADIEYLINNYPSRVEYDNNTQSVLATVTIGPGDKKPRIWGGRVLEAGTYNIWYDNETATKYKLELIKGYDLLGVASWSLGQETESTWDYFKKWLDDRYFNDMINHWAEEYVLNLRDKGWIVGTSPNTFSPDNKLTRAEAVTVLVKAMGLQDEEGYGGFNDTKGHWAEKFINIAHKYNIVQGVGNGLFAPEAFITREEMALMLDNVLLVPDTVNFHNNKFSDVSEQANPWSYASIIRLSNSGVINGMPDGSFRPKDNLLRSEMAALMYNASKYDMNPNKNKLEQESENSKGIEAR